MVYNPVGRAPVAAVLSVAVPLKAEKTFTYQASATISKWATGAHRALMVPCKNDQSGLLQFANVTLVMAAAPLAAQK